MNLKKEEMEKIRIEFTNTWNIILEEILTDPKFHDIRYTMDWLGKVLEKNVPFGTHASGFLCIYMYRTLKAERTEEEDLQNYVCAWMIEMLQASITMLGDIMSNAETRDGRLCWHRNAGVGLSAINDAFLLENMAYISGFKFFSGKEYLLKIINLFRNNALNTFLGETLNLALTNTTPTAAPDLNRFTESTYKALVKYKTSYFTFYAPVAAAMLRAGVDDQASLDAVEKITLKVGELFQIQTDFLDCYGDPEITGKIGSDIKDGRLTWLIVKALELASEPQQEILHKFYGQPGLIAAEQQIKDVYEALEIEELFYKHEDEVRLEVLADIKELPNTVPQDPFLAAIAAIYRREK